MSKAQYPLLLIPSEYLLYCSGNPYPNSFLKSEPVRPNPEIYKDASYAGCVFALTPLAGFCVVIFIFASLSGDKASQADLIGTIISVVVLIIGFLVQSSMNSEKAEVVNRNQLLQKNYEKERDKYYEEKREYERLKRIEQNDKFDREYRSTKLTEILNNTDRAQIEYKGVKGRAEKSFVSILQKVFEGRIFTDLVIETFSMAKPYQPDIIFFYEELNLSIDIEIDEVYDMVYNKPIHYIDDYGCFKDQERNDYFLNKGWFVVRFTESQVLNNPIGCCKFLNGILIEYLGIDDFGNLDSREWKRIQDLQREDCWTYEEATEVARLGHRNRST